MYAFGRFDGSPFKLESKWMTKILPRFCSNKTVPTLSHEAVGLIAAVE